MAEQYRLKYGEDLDYSSSPTPASTTTATTPPSRQTTMTDVTQYSPYELRDIGKQCQSRLPPASAFQAMFLYEMQRETEVESLFQGQMFRLAKHEDAAVKQQRHIDALEDRLAQLEKQMEARDAQERLAPSNTRMNAQQHQLNDCTSRLDGFESKLSFLDDQMNHLRDAHSANPNATAVASPPTLTLSPPSEEALQTMKEELDVLFDDRDGIVLMLEDVKARLTKLEDNVRALTLQGTASKSPAIPLHQRLHLQTSNGEKLDLGVPKGQAHVSLKEKRPTLAAIRSFSPGKQWAD